MDKRDTVYIVGDARTQEDNPITFQYGRFFIGIIVDRETDEIVDFECSAILDITNRFLRELFIGRKIPESYKTIENELDERYFGSSKKAILVALKDAIKKYESHK